VGPARLPGEPRVVGLGDHGFDVLGGEFSQYRWMHGLLLFGCSVVCCSV
jgi:hypothetical protein